jgi:sRNA-binding carbon storage regulator CsrA
MLILTRRPGEKLIIGAAIEMTAITVVSSSRGPFMLYVDSYIPGVTVVNTYHPGDVILLPGSVHIHLSHTQHSINVRFAITAPRSVPVDRAELWVRKYGPLPLPVKASGRGTLRLSA